MTTTAYDFSARDIAGNERSFTEFRGKALLIVNVASQCGFTPHYAGLEALYRQYEGRGLVVLGFPCDQFGHQEPGSEAQIQQFCQETYDVTFPMFAKVDVNGERAHPLFRWLKTEKRGLLGTSRIKWNFTKFLVDRNGHVVRRYAPNKKPLELAGHVSKLLDAS